MGKRIGNRAANRERWKERVRQADRHPGGLAEYCRLNHLSLGALSYWRKKNKTQHSELAQRPAFIPVQVMASEQEIPSPQLPDSKWVAELILHLTAGMSRSLR